MCRPRKQTNQPLLSIYIKDGCKTSSVKRDVGGREVRAVSTAPITGYILKINVKEFIVSLSTKRMVYSGLDHRVRRMVQDGQSCRHKKEMFIDSKLAQLPVTRMKCEH